MKLLIKLNSQNVLVEAEDAGPIVTALSKAKLVNREGYSSNAKFVPDPDGSIEIEILADERLLPTPDPIKKLQEEKNQADSRWIEYYNKANEVQNKLTALQKDLDARGIQYTKEEKK